MISIIDVSNNLEVASGTLPLTFQRSVFFAVGGELTIGGVLRYRAVNRVIVNDKPGEYYAPTGQTVVYDAANDRIVVTIQYPGAPNLPIPSATDVFNDVFPQTRAAQMIFAGFLELARRVGALDGQSPANLTPTQLMNWFVNKVPPQS